MLIAKIPKNLHYGNLVPYGLEGTVKESESKEGACLLPIKIVYSQLLENSQRSDVRTQDSLELNSCSTLEI